MGPETPAAAMDSQSVAPVPRICHGPAAAGAGTPRAIEIAFDTDVFAQMDLSRARPWQAYIADAQSSKVVMHTLPFLYAVLWFFGAAAWAESLRHLVEENRHHRVSTTRAIGPAGASMWRRASPARPLRLLPEHQHEPCVQYSAGDSTGNDFVCRHADSVFPPGQFLSK